MNQIKISHALLIVLTTSLLSIPISASAGYCVQTLDIGCPSCINTPGAWRANNAGGQWCTDCGGRCPVWRTPEEAAEMAQALGGEPYARSEGRMVLTTEEPHEATDAYGIDISANLILEIAKADPIAASALYNFHPSRWTPNLSLYKGRAISSLLFDRELLGLVISGASSDEILAQATKLPKETHFIVSWSGYDEGDDMLAVTMTTELVDDHEGVVPPDFHNTITTVYVSRSDAKLMYFKQSIVGN